MLESPWGGYRLSLGDPSPGEGNLELTNAPTNSYYHHIDAAYDCSVYYQLSNPFCLCPGQQATTCSVSSTRIHETTPDPWKISLTLTATRTLRLETSKRGRPSAPRPPTSAGSSQRDLDAPILKELGLPFLKGGLLGG